MRIEVSVVITTKNRALQTVEAVKSVLQQTYPVQEIVVVDDGSDESEVKALVSLLPKDERISLKLLEMPTFHPGIARKIGIQLTNSDWIAFLDSDDLWLPNKIESQINFVLQSKARALSCNALRQIPHLSVRSKFFAELPNKLDLKTLLKRNYIITSSVLIRRDLLKQVSFFATSYSVRSAEDYATWLRCASISDWHCLDQALVVYKDDIKNGIRGDGEIKQNFSDVIGIIDFANWQISREHQPSYYRKMLRKFGIALLRNGIVS